MGFLQIFESSTDVPDPPTNTAASISAGNLANILELYNLPSFEESYELHDVKKPHRMKLCSSKTATIVAMVETDQIPVEICAEPDLDDTISALFSTACESAQSSRKLLPIIRFSKWDNMHLFVVAALTPKDEIRVSIAAIPEQAMVAGSDANIAMLADTKQYLCDIWQDLSNMREEVKTIHLVFGLRGGGGRVGGGRTFLRFLVDCFRKEETRPWHGSVPGLVRNQIYEDFKAGDPRVHEEENYDEFMSRIPSGSVMDKLRQHSRPIAPSETTIRPLGLYFEEQLQIGKTFRKTTYQAVEGELIITFRSFVRPGGGSIEVEGEGRVSGNKAGSLRFLAKRAFKLKENIELRGLDAQYKALADMKYFKDIRWWVLSCLIKGTLRVNSASIMDGFIPPHIERIDDSGIKLVEAIELEWLREMGGTVATIGDAVVFRAHIKGELFEVTDIGNDRVLTIGDCINPEKEAKVFLWDEQNLKVARKTSDNAPTGILSRLRQRVGI